MPIADPPPAQYAEAKTYYLDYITDLPQNAGLAPAPDFKTMQYYCAKPENLAMDDAMGGPGNISWEWTLTSEDVEGNPVIREYDLVGPWRSWWRLRCGSTVIESGPILDYGGKMGDQFVRAAGKTFEAYLPMWQYPFDPRPDHVNDYRYDNTFINDEAAGSGDPTPTGLVYQANNRDVLLIAYDLLRKTMNGVSNRMLFDLAALNNTVGIKTNFQYTLGDDSGMDSALSNLVAIGEGFDYWISWDMAFKVGSPYRYGSSLSPNISYFLDVDTPGLISLDYDDPGIQGTHVLGRGAGLAVQTQMGSAFGYEQAQEVYSRLDVAYDYGDIRNQTQLNNMTKKSLSIIIDPLRELTVIIDPAAMIEAGIDYWGTFRKGRAIYVTVDTGFHNLNAPYRIKNWSLADENNTGNMQVTLTLDRIYPQVADFGNPDI